MKKRFEDYLIKQGYSVTTPSGNPSTVYAYQKCIDKICEWENLTWYELVNNISSIVVQYDAGGAKEELGNKSHKSVINALHRFEEFINYLE